MAEQVFFVEQAIYRRVYVLLIHFYMPYFDLKMCATYTDISNYILSTEFVITVCFDYLVLQRKCNSVICRKKSLSYFVDFSFE